METQRKGIYNGVFLGCPGDGKGTYNELPVEAKNLPPRAPSYPNKVQTARVVLNKIHEEQLGILLQIDPQRTSFIMGETIHGDWGDFIILKNVQMLLRSNLKDGTRDCPINNSTIGDEQAYLKVARSPTKQPAASLMITTVPSFKTTGLKESLQLTLTEP